MLYNIHFRNKGAPEKSDRALSLIIRLSVFQSITYFKFYWAWKSCYSQMRYKGSKLTFLLPDRIDVRIVIEVTCPFPTIRSLPAAVTWYDILIRLKISVITFSHDKLEGERFFRTLARIKSKLTILKKKQINTDVDVKEYLPTTKIKYSIQRNAMFHAKIKFTLEFEKDKQIHVLVLLNDKAF